MEEAAVPRVLIVDDEPYIRELIQRCLEMEGYDCHTAAHVLVSLPVVYQQFPLNERGELLVPESKVAELPAELNGVTLTGQPPRLQLLAADGHALLPVVVVPDGGLPADGATAVDGVDSAPPN